ncbi:hypothetical protein QBC46DRAFT_426532, partial [Diplogelasinospora grovesii]
FEALSYVWGPQLLSSNVRCGNGIIGVGENLPACLKELRNRDSVRTLCIDRVATEYCKMTKRRRPSRFSLLMADIYTAASQVVVWLGPADSGTSAAVVELINDVANQALSYSQQ